ncbi:reverse transcriptase family protein, partial [Chromobacterium amazonense]|uniref:reverse transcriptase family protein n=1 Tax=Chromobacterium amazonense TaxID=1382803 RepID=UPI00237E717D
SCHFPLYGWSSGYNQIKIAPEDERNIAFHTPIKIYCYKVMPFDRKNAGGTYQQAMTHIINELIHHQVGCYNDDLVVKSKEKEDHLFDLRVVFKRLS